MLKDKIDGLVSTINQFNGIYREMLRYASIMGELIVTGNKASLKIKSHDGETVENITIEGNFDGPQEWRKLWTSIYDKIKVLEEEHGTISISGLKVFRLGKDIYHTDDPSSRIFAERVGKLYIVK